jgi:hypothetical protein
MFLFFAGVALGDGSGPGEGVGVGVQPAKMKQTTIIMITLMGFVRCALYYSLAYD